MEATPQNKRTMLGNALYLIRIPTMTLEEFANGAAQKGILTQQETIDIFFHFTANNKPSLQYPIKARAGLKSQVLIEPFLSPIGVCNFPHLDMPSLPIVRLSFESMEIPGKM